MKFTKPNCPKCGKHADTIMEIVQRRYGLKAGADGESEYDYGSIDDVIWETSALLLDLFGQALLRCSECDEEWASAWETQPDRAACEACGAPFIEPKEEKGGAD